MRRWGTRLATGWAVALVISLPVHAEHITSARLTELCARAEGPAHCGKLVEAEQLKSLPNLASRDGLTLRVLLYPSGTRDFVDVEALHGDKTWSLWDYWSALNAVVLFTTDADRIGYAVLRRATGQVAMLPSEPVLSPDRQRLAVADFCPAGCDNEVTVWQVTRDSIRKDLIWKPGAEWSDVTVQWKSDETLVVEFTPKGEDKSRTVERRLADPQ
jgi:hypothetical protein